MGAEEIGIRGRETEGGRGKGRIGRVGEVAGRFGGGGGGGGMVTVGVVFVEGGLSDCGVGEWGGGSSGGAGSAGGASFGLGRRRLGVLEEGYVLKEGRGH